MGFIIFLKFGFEKDIEMKYLILYNMNVWIFVFEYNCFVNWWKFLGDYIRD